MICSFHQMQQHKDSCLRILKRPKPNNNLLQVASSPELRSQFTLKIKKQKETIATQENRLKRLRCNAAAQQRFRKKRKETIEKENVVEMYDTRDHPSFLIND